MDTISTEQALHAVLTELSDLENKCSVLRKRAFQLTIERVSELTAVLQQRMITNKIVHDEKHEQLNQKFHQLSNFLQGLELQLSDLTVAIEPLLQREINGTNTPANT